MCLGVRACAPPRGPGKRRRAGPVRETRPGVTEGGRGGGGKPGGGRAAGGIRAGFSPAPPAAAAASRGRAARPPPPGAGRGPAAAACGGARSRAAEGAVGRVGGGGLERDGGRRRARATPFTPPPAPRPGPAAWRRGGGASFCSPTALSRRPWPPLSPVLCPPLLPPLPHGVHRWAPRCRVVPLHPFPGSGGETPRVCWGRAVPAAGIADELCLPGTSESCRA